MKQIHLYDLDPSTLFEGTANNVCRELLPAIKNILEDSIPNQYYSAEKICQMLDITKPTLHLWRKRGIISCYKLGSRAYYRWSEIEKAMTII